MSFVRIKVWTQGEILTAADLNSEFDAVATQDQNLGTPRTSLFDMNAQELVLDADGDTSITADTDDQVDVRLGGFDALQIKTVVSAIDGFEMTTSAAGATTPIEIAARGTSSDIDINISPKGAGGITFGGGNTAIAELEAQGSATNIGVHLIPKGTGEVRVTQGGLRVEAGGLIVAAGGIQATGGVAVTGDLDVSGDLELTGDIQDDSENELIEFVSTSSAVNQIRVTNTATGVAPLIDSSGEANIPLRVRGSGTGALQLGDADLAWPDADGSSGNVLSTDGAGVLSWIANANKRVLVDSATAAGGAAVDLDLDSVTGYDIYEIEIIALVPQTNNINFGVRLSNDGGATFRAGTVYNYSLNQNSAAGDSPFGNNSATGATSWLLSGSSNIDNTAGLGGLRGSIFLYNAHSATIRTAFVGTYMYMDSTNVPQLVRNGGILSVAAEDNDAVRFIDEAGGNLSSGTVRLWGLTSS